MLKLKERLMRQREKAQPGKICRDGNPAPSVDPWTICFKTESATIKGAYH